MIKIKILLLIIIIPILINAYYKSFVAITDKDGNNSLTIGSDGKININPVSISSLSNGQVQLISGNNIIGYVFVTNILQTKITDGLNIASIDSLEKSLKTVDVFHSEVHTGEAFRWDYIYYGVANNAVVYSLISVPLTNKYPHLHISAGASGASVVWFTKNPVATNNGTVKSAINFNRTSLNNSVLTISYNALITNRGQDLLNTYLFGGTTAQTRIGGIANEEQEWILQTNMLYCLKTSNASGSAANIIHVLEWYSHE